MLGAHFMRGSEPFLTIVCILTPFILLIKKRFSLILVQVMAYAGGSVWIYTIIEIARRRIEYGQPWIRMAIILGAVALITVLAGLLLNSRKMKEKYPLNKETGDG